MCCSFFGQWSFKKKCFWDLLTFSKLRLLSIKKQQYKLCTQCLILSRIHIIIKKLNKQGVGRKTKCHSLQLFAIWIFWYEVHEKTKGSESSLTKLTSQWQASEVEALIFPSIKRVKSWTSKIQRLAISKLEGKNYHHIKLINLWKIGGTVISLSFLPALLKSAIYMMHIY